MLGLDLCHELGKKGNFAETLRKGNFFCTPPLPLLHELVLVVFVMIPKGRREGSGHEHVAQAVGGHLQDPQQLAAHLEHDGALAGGVDVPAEAIKTWIKTSFEKYETRLRARRV